MENSELVIKVEDLQRVVLAPHDVLVIRLAENDVKPERLNSIMEHLHGFFPDNKTLIITKDMDVFVIAKQV